MVRLIKQSIPYSISHGTLRSQDLLPRFAETIEEFTGQKPNCVKDIPESVWNGEDNEFWYSEECQGIIQELMEELDKIAKSGEIWDNLYFGISGDPTDFGFWNFDRLEL